MEGVAEELATTPLALAEMDHLVSRLGGQAGRRALRRDLEAGAYAVEWWREATRTSLLVAHEYEWLELGLTDASLVALAAELDTTRMATLDERHFRAVRPLSGEAAFTLLPADAG